MGQGPEPMGVPPLVGGGRYERRELMGPGPGAHANGGPSPRGWREVREAGAHGPSP